MLGRYSFTNCLMPKRIVNPYTHESLVVPCGHCEACTLAKNSRLSFQCDLESKSHKYTMFVTLTYMNSTIPRATFVDSLDRPFDKDIVDKETGEILGPAGCSQSMCDKLLEKFYLFGDIPYLRKPDLQKFLKRFRYYATKITNEKVRYFAVGEYGPVHFRPHYHLLLFFDSQELFQVCSELVSKAWPFGRVDCQKSIGQCSQYVTGYVNSGCTLPQVFKAGSLRPFAVHSQKLGQGFLHCERAKVYSLTAREFIKRSCVLNGKFKEFDLWRSAYSYFYPKCHGFADKSSRERAYSYELYSEARYFFPEAETCAALAREIASILHIFGSSLSTFCLEMFPSNRDYKRYVDLLQYFSHPDEKADVETETFQRYVNRIYIQLLTSKHFLTFVCDSCTSYERKRKLRLIEEFYSQLDYLHLVDFFESQQLYFESDFAETFDVMDSVGENNFLPYFYNNVRYDFEEYSTSRPFLVFKSERLKLFQDRIKHKKLNDLNKIFINP